MISKSFPQTHKVVLLSYPFANLTCLFVQISISKTSWPRQIQGVWSRHHGGLGQARSPRLGGDIYFDAGERWAGDKCSLTIKNITGASFLMFWPSESYSFLRSLSSTDKLHIYIHVYSYSLSRSDFHNIRTFLSLDGIVEVCCWWPLSTKSGWQSVSTHHAILSQWCFPYTGKYIWPWKIPYFQS